ncbi:MAG TPA: hypothetical protein DCL63_01775 [Firmicutes bacterium]|jgi:3-oxoacyl-[acyl-carrier-protein] synthase III|nr:hypothetical protein [Bacillota bacterium]HBK59226.1 hypothetical protein [Bacillota bacterium]
MQYSAYARGGRADGAYKVMPLFWGYTGSACVPMALDDAVSRGRIRSGDLVTLVGSGVGYNQAGVALLMP